VTLRAKLVWAQVPLLLSLILVGLVSRRTVAQLDASSRNILKDNYESVTAVQRIRDAAGELVRAARDHRDGEASARTIERQLQFQEHNITEPGERELTGILRKQWEELRVAPGEAAQLALDKTAGQIIALNQEGMVRKSDAARASGERMNALMTAVTLAACVLGLLASMYLTNRLVRPLSVLSQAVRRLGQGDLQARARLEGGDELAQLGGEFNAMATRLAEYRSSSLGELLQAQQASQAAIDSLPDPVLVLQVDRLLNANRAAEDLFGVSVEEELAQAPAEVRALVAKMREHVASGRGAYVPKGLDEAVAIPLREGSRHFLARANPVVSEAGAVVGLTILFQDVERLRRFDELKNDLVATVAHEFRTPLTSMRMAIHLFLEGSVGSLNEKQSELMFAARDDCERLQNIVDDLLDLSRIQAGRIDLHARPVSAAALVAQAVDTHRAAATDKGVTLAVGEVVDRPVLADPDRVQLVLTNLVQNAIRHTPAGGRIEVRGLVADGSLRFEVGDTGPGISREHLQRLFQRFSRVPGTPGAGAGLGLYICKEIVEAHGGQIAVDSAPGKGSTFWFTLPPAAS
jgi:signal transduction histidine kinase